MREFFLSATRTAYDAVADLYNELFGDVRKAHPVDRASIEGFAELVRRAGGGPVGDLGCGPGHLTAHLDALGLDVFGVDLSEAMVALARRRSPHLRFDVGSMAALDVPDGGLGGVLSWYSLIHTPPQRTAGVLAEFDRVLAPGGHLLLAFLASGRPYIMTEPFDHKVALAYRWSPRHLADLLSRSGLTVISSVLREPEQGERFRQAHLLARKM